MKKGYVPFCTIVTTRRKYKKEGFGIDLDIIDFGYRLAEIEYMTDDQGKISEATQAIISLAKKHNIDTDAIVRGKVVEYLRLHNPAHFQALIDGKVIK
jgi:adenylate cyclase class IV